MLRVLTYNIHKGIGWGIRNQTIQQIKKKITDLQSDIIFLQEIRGKQVEILLGEIWPHFSYGKNRIVKRGDYGNAILSKYPVLYSKNIDLSMHRYEHRGLLHTIIKLPTQESLHLICVHLGLFEIGRRKQLDLIVNYINLAVPANARLILSGDFNDWIKYATRPLVKNLQLNEAFLNFSGKYAYTYPAWAPILQLDRIYFRGLLVKNAHRLLQRQWRFLSDHIALEAQFEL